MFSSSVALQVVYGQAARVAGDLLQETPVEGEVNQLA